MAERNNTGCSTSGQLVSYPQANSSFPRLESQLCARVIEMEQRTRNEVLLHRCAMASACVKEHP